MKTKIVAGLVVAAGLVLAAVVYFRQETAPLSTYEAPRPIAHAPAVPERPAPDVTTAPSNRPPEIQPAKTGGQINVRTQQVVVQPRVAAPPVAVTEPEARAALSLVGADPDADEIWGAAINDPKLPATARQNLIEDLNEDGLSDPQNPTVDDLPLIVSRLQLIEELAPDAMDEVNWDAFMEAYKDLWDMYVRLTQ
jgi:hypothetical protein